MNVQSNFRFIKKNIDVSKILQQVLDNPNDWDHVKTIRNAAGDLNPYGFLPLTMAVVLEAHDDPKDTEFQEDTPLKSKYTEIRKFLIDNNVGDHSRAAFFRLRPGDSVDWHIDEGKYYLTRDR